MRELGEVLNFNFADDIQMEWDAYMEDGLTIEEATTQILDQYTDMLDGEECMLMYIALALLQEQLEYIDGRIKEEVSDILCTNNVESCFAEDNSIKKIIQKLKQKCR